MSGFSFPQMGVFFVSREPVRNPQPLHAFADVRAALERARPGQKIAGTLSCAAQGRFAIAFCPDGLGIAAESAIAEVYEYDPVRYQAMIIGLVEPPQSTPIHWIARRVNPESSLVAVIPNPPPIGPTVAVQPFPKGYVGDPTTLLAIGKLVKGRSVTAIDRVGLVACAKDGADLAHALGGVLRKSSKNGGPT